MWNQEQSAFQFPSFLCLLQPLPRSLVPHPLRRMGSGSYSWAICDQGSDLNPINSSNVVGPLGPCNSFSFGKNCFRLMGCQENYPRENSSWLGAGSDLPSQKLRSRGRHRLCLSVSQVTCWSDPCFQALHKHLPDTPSDWFVSVWGGKPFDFLDGLFFGLGPSYHGHKMLMYQQAMAKLPQCHLLNQHLLLHVHQASRFLTTRSTEERLVSN